MAKQKRSVSIVVLTYNNLEITKECFEHLRRNTDNYELLVIDNNSRDDTPEYLTRLEAQWPQLRIVLNDENRGFAGGCNQGVEIAKHERICLLNNDTIPFPGWLSSLNSAMANGVGIVGAKLVFPNGLLQHAGIHFSYVDKPVPHFRPNHRYYRRPDSPLASRVEEVVGVTAACLLTTKSVWNEVGGLDEAYVQANYEDVDFNLKVRDAGYKVMYQPGARLIHFEHATISSLEGTDEDPMQHWEANLELLNERWFDKLQGGLASIGGGAAA